MGCEGKRWVSLHLYYSQFDGELRDVDIFGSSMT